jgi:hypothetical protein
MQYAALMGIVNRAGQRSDNLYSGMDWHWLSLHGLVQAPALDKLHAVKTETVAIPYFVDRHDVRVVQARRRFGFDPESFHPISTTQLPDRNALERHHAV